MAVVRPATRVCAGRVPTVGTVFAVTATAMVAVAVALSGSAAVTVTVVVPAFTAVSISTPLACRTAAVTTPVACVDPATLYVRASPLASLK